MWVWTKEGPRTPRRAPKITKNFFLVMLEAQIHVFPTFFDGRCCGFDTSLDVLGSSKERPGGSLGAPKLTLGGLRGVPRERAPRLEAPRRGLGNDFCNPKQSAYAPFPYIYMSF